MVIAIGRRRELVTQSSNYYCIKDAEARAREMEFEGSLF
jgi:hypothetical protein